jgi:predicted dehydrogenase
VSALVRTALIGAGSMGSLHARVISQSPRAALAAVIDPDRTAGERVAGRFGAQWYPALDAVSDVDAVVVAAATETHPALGQEVLGRGLPLLMEKPLAHELTDAQQLVEVAAQADLPLMCGLLERYNPAVVTAAALLDTPRYIAAQRHSPYVPRIRTGVSSDLLLHDVDIALRLAGAEPASVRGSFGFLHPDSQPGSEDVAEALLGFPDGLVANLSASRVSQHKVRTLNIGEQNRLIELDLLRNSVTIYRHVLNEIEPDGLGYKQQTIIEIPALATSREPLAAQLDRFLDLLDGRADLAEERAAILPAHRVIDRVRRDAVAQK